MNETTDSTSGANGFLSIREVLDELVGEFHDITISKIRFLESRGLIQPERTPSGYRKFYPADVERLRWILRQQREHFLPLKVIKRRLDLDEGRKPELPDSPSLFDDVLAEAAADEALASVVSKIRLAARVHTDVEAPETHAHKAIVNDSVSSLHAPTDDPIASKTHLAAVPTPNGPAPDAIGAGGQETGAKHMNHPSQIEGGEVVSTTNEPMDVPNPASVTPDAGIPKETTTTRSTDPSPTPTPRARKPSGAKLSIDELAVALSTSVLEIAELEEFGFIASQVVAGEPCFDGDALVIAQAITALRSFGLEPRHLKSVRMAAERDASLYAKVVTPLLRQRNPESTQKAQKQLRELADRGVALYEQILRTELRRLGG